MSFVGGSISQALALDGQDARLSAVETLAASKVATSTYEAKMVLLDAKDVEHDSMIALKLSTAVYELKMAGLDAHDAANDVSIADLEARADALEARATAIEDDISGRVDAAIAEKVATTTFDALASELRDADSALTTALATKVATVVQAAKDAEQDAKDAEHDGKLAALVEFVRAMLATYTITKPDGNAYAWTGAAQGLSFDVSGGGGGGSPPPAGDYPIVINSAANGEINITSSVAYAQNYVAIVEIVNGAPDFNMTMSLNGGAVGVGTATFLSGFFQPFNAGKVIALYALPADKAPWDAISQFGVRASADFTLV